MTGRCRAWWLRVCNGVPLLQSEVEVDRLLCRLHRLFGRGFAFQPVRAVAPVAAPAGIPAALVAPGARFRRVTAAVASGVAARTGFAVVPLWLLARSFVAAFGRLPRLQRVAGAVLDLAVLAAAAELGPVGNLALKDLAEGVRIDRACKPERRRAFAGPAAGLPVCRVVPGVLAIALVVGRALRRRRDDADRGYHRQASASVR